MSKRALWWSAGGVALALLAALVLSPRNGGTQPESAPRPVAARGTLDADERNNIEVKRVSPSVVNITSLAVGRQPFSLDVMQMPRGNGSGFLWDERGHVVTNFHVIQEGDAATVTLGDQSSHRAWLVGYFADRDIAVLKIARQPGAACGPAAVPARQRR